MTPPAIAPETAAALFYLHTLTYVALIVAWNARRAMHRCSRLPASSRQVLRQDARQDARQLAIDSGQTLALAFSGTFSGTFAGAFAGRRSGHGIGARFRRTLSLARIIADYRARSA